MNHHVGQRTPKKYILKACCHCEQIAQKCQDFLNENHDLPNELKVQVRILSEIKSLPEDPNLNQIQFQRLIDFERSIKSLSSSHIDIEEHMRSLDDYILRLEILVDVSTLLTLDQLGRQEIPTGIKVKRNEYELEKILCSKYFREFWVRLKGW